jgi:hypothetical protein
MSQVDRVKPSQVDREKALDMALAQKKESRQPI